MTKEELEKEAKEWLCNNLHSASEEDFIKAMVDIAEPREKRIAELEKENLVLHEMNVKRLDLQKENAELKESLKKWKDAIYADVENYDKQFTKAIEIIKELVEWANWQGNSRCPSFKSIQDKAEQFLNSEGK